MRPWQPRACCVDVDGVLVDTETVYFEGWRSLMAELGHAFELDEYRPLAGFGGREILTTLCQRRGITRDIDELRARRVAIVRQLMTNGVPVIELNIQLVHQFALDRSLRFAAASSSYRADVMDKLALAGLTELIGTLACADDRPDMPRKPAPDLYLLAAKQLGLQPEACLAFEDSAPGVRAAKAAGMRCIALPNAITIHQDLSAADLVIAPEAPRDAVAILQHFCR